MGFIYLIKNSEDCTYKIGVAKDPRKRLKEIQTGNSSELLIVDMYQTENSFKIEKILHRRYSHLHKHGEWFSLSLIEQFNFLDDCKKIEEGIAILRESGNTFV